MQTQLPFEEVGQLQLSINTAEMHQETAFMSSVTLIWNTQQHENNDLTVINHFWNDLVTIYLMFFHYWNESTESLPELAHILFLFRIFFSCNYIQYVVLSMGHVIGMYAA